MAQLVGTSCCFQDIQDSNPPSSIVTIKLSTHQKKKKSPFISGLAISQIKREFHPIVIVIE